jgi:hypothetical protein
MGIWLGIDGDLGDLDGGGECGAAMLNPFDWSRKWGVVSLEFRYEVGQYGIGVNIAYRCQICKRGSGTD